MQSKAVYFLYIQFHDIIQWQSREIVRETISEFFLGHEVMM